MARMNSGDTLTANTSDISSLRGVHIFHATTLSNCSQRVLMVAEEKGLAYRAHAIDLGRGEQLSPAYLAINPKGLVPALVHDGRVVCESNAIIQYLEKAFARPALAPMEEAARSDMEALLRESDAVQGFIKTLTFEFLLNPMAKMSPARLEQYARQQTDATLVAFHRTFSTTGFSREEIRRAAHELTSRLPELERRLSLTAYLCGDTLSLADISWLVNVHRMILLGLRLKPHRRVRHWFAGLAARPSYRRSVDRLEPFAMRAVFALKVAQRRMKRDAIEAYLPQV